MISKSIAAILGVVLCTVVAFSQERERNVSAKADFDMPAYLAGLSAEGKQRGYKEFTYKETPQGELRIYFAMPAGWSPSDKRPVLIFFFGGGWVGGKVFSGAKEAEHFSQRGVVVGLA